ncbi:CsbD family protein [Burkholderia cenocepacia]|uniref:CsbD family protein n=2 Tax=Burkholderia cenocepacia TaxID=95486 RepID=A0A3Q9FAW8_9BURK|nr:CsbD family protein [Burkholderia cenocepacia]
MMNRDQMRGRIAEAKGKLKEMVGRIMGNRSTRMQGKVEQVVGKTQASFGDAKEQLRKRP